VVEFVLCQNDTIAVLPVSTTSSKQSFCIMSLGRVSILCGMRKKLAEFSIVCSVTNVVVCYLLNKCVATVTIVLLPSANR